MVINNNEEIVELIKSCYNGNIEIWNFYSGLLLKNINVTTSILREICFWDNEYLFVGCDDGTIKLIEYKNGRLIKELKGHNKKVISIKKKFILNMEKFYFLRVLVWIQ